MSDMKDERVTYTEHHRRGRHGVRAMPRAAIVAALALVIATIGPGLAAAADVGPDARVVAQPEDVVAAVGEPIEVSARIEGVDELRWQTATDDDWVDLDERQHPSAVTDTLTWTEASADLDGTRVRLVGVGDGDEAAVTDEALVTVTIPPDDESEEAESAEEDRTAPEQPQSDERVSPRAEEDGEDAEDADPAASAQEESAGEAPVREAPSLRDPESMTVPLGDEAAFTAGLDVEAETRWQSTEDGASWATIAGADEPTLTLPQVTAGVEGLGFRAVFTEADGTVHTTTAATLSVQSAPTETYTSPVDPTVTYTVPTEIRPGEDIVVSGSGWTTQSGDEGSVVTILLDARVSGDPDTVMTKRDVVNPITGQVSGDKRLHAIVEADAEGNWTATIPFPTSENSSAGDTTTTWEVGRTHYIRMLSGSMKTGDTARGLGADFDVVEEYSGPGDPGPGEPPSWPHVTVEHESGATAWVGRDVAAGDDGTLRIKGTGWTNEGSDRASTVAIKLNRSDTAQYSRSGSGIVSHPSAAGDDTIWVLLAPENPTSHPHVVTVEEGGDFEIEVAAPPGLQAGQYLTVLFQSGLFDGADPTRAVSSPFLTVGGVEYVEETDPGQQVTCRPSTPGPRYEFVEETVPLGGVLRVRGTGWCHPGAERGGSRIAIKIDAGAYSHVHSRVHSNRTIWAIVDADGRTGDWTANIRLPDGTGRTSTPAFPEGAHTLQLLTGSLKPGDAVRTTLTDEFVVGTYRPNRTPDPVEAREDLTQATRGGVSVQQSRERIRVTIPGASRGDWIFLTAYDRDGSPRYPWGDRWFRADADGQVVAPLSGTTLPAGRPKLAVQSGNQGEFGELLGWTHLRVAGPPSASASNRSGAASSERGGQRPSRYAAPPGGSGGAGGVLAGAAQADPVPEKPDWVPDPPVASSADLTDANSGDVTGVQEGTVVTLTVPGAEPGDWVFVYAYSEPLAVGWIQVDEDAQIRIDIAGLPPGDHKLAVLDDAGDLLGWAGVTVDGDEAAAEASSSVPVVPATAAGATGLLSATDWWLIAGAAVLVLFVVGLIAILGSARGKGPVA